jgi:hypothetical protein
MVGMTGLVVGYAALCVANPPYGSYEFFQQDGSWFIALKTLKYPRAALVFTRTTKRSLQTNLGTNFFIQFWKMSVRMSTRSFREWED